MSKKVFMKQYASQLDTTEIKVIADDNISTRSSSPVFGKRYQPASSPKQENVHTLDSS
jgi:hypothetical protein